MGIEHLETIWRGALVSAAGPFLCCAAGTVMPLLAEVLQLLMSSYRVAFRPSLEHIVSLVATLLPTEAAEPAQHLSSPQQQLAGIAIRLLRVSGTVYKFQMC